MRVLCRFHGAGRGRPARGRTSAYGIDPHLGIAVDVTHATDCPYDREKEEGDIALGKGPVIYRGPNMNPRVVATADAAADELPDPLSTRGHRPGQPHRRQRHSGESRGRGGRLVSVPNRYMHSPVEMISLDDIDRTPILPASARASIPRPVTCHKAPRHNKKLIDLFLVVQASRLHLWAGGTPAAQKS